jgi:hypothetical protein
MRVTFKHWDCRVVPGYYSNGRLALSLTGDEGPIAVATVNMVDEPLEEGEVCIKDYSENEGMFAALAAAGLVESEPVRTVQSGFVEVPVGKLTLKALAWLEENGRRA